MITSETLRRAADLADEIQTKQAELNQLLSGEIEPAALSATVAQPTSPARTGGKQKRQFSPEAIAKIKAAQRRRWKKVRKEQKAALNTATVSAPAPVATPAPAAPAPVATPAPVTAPAAVPTTVPAVANQKKGQLVAA